jgi:ATP-dependent DNA helicase RecQ
VTRGKYEHGRFDDELVEASASLIRERWRPAPAPGWVTAVPSAAHAALVGDFAARLALALGLPYVDVMTTLAGAQPQKEMQNSVQQAENARRKLSVRGELVLTGPVLLVDDMVDSRWTMTVAGELLRQHGSGAVHPFALAVATGRGA